MKKILKFILKFIFGFCLILTLPSCKKTYDEGSDISILSKKQRLTNKWKLTSIRIGESIAPEIPVITTQIIELTNDEISDGVYRAYFTSFQEEFCWSNPDTSGEDYFTTDGTWQFFDGAFGGGCNIGEELDEKEGLILTIQVDINKEISHKWKIVKLTRNELELYTNVCFMSVCYYTANRKLTFEKIK